MKIMGNEGLGNKLKIILQICYFGGIFGLIALPFLLKAVGLYLSAAAYVIYPNGIVLLVITHKFIKLFESLKQNNPFCDENVKILKTTAIASVIGAILWILDLAYEFILAQVFDIVFIVVLLFLGILYFGVAIALYILSELLREGAKYKKENELTI